MDKTRVLVVEDEVIVARDLQQGLIELGYDVPDIAISGDEAISVVVESRPDLVLMDIHLKGDRDGIDVATELRHRFAIPVVYLTAYADAPTLNRAKLTEPFGYILKPLQLQEVQTTIEISLYKHQMEQQLHRAHVALQEAHDELAGQLQVAEGRDRLVQCQMRGPTQQEAHEEIVQVLVASMPVKQVMLYLPHDDEEDLVVATAAPSSAVSGDQAVTSVTRDRTDLVEQAYRLGRPQCDADRCRAAVPVLYRHKPLGVIWAAVADDMPAFSQQRLNGICSLAAQSALLLRMAAITAAVSSGAIAADQLLHLD